MELFAYARVSTREQRDRQTIETQKLQIEQYCKERGYEIKSWFLDEGISAVKERPQFEAMLEQLDQADGILCTKLDRLGRSLLHILKTVERIQDQDKQFLCVDQLFDLSTSEGRLNFQVLAAVAEFERNLTIDRIRAGIERARAEGKQLGRKKRTIPKKRLKLLLKAKTPLTAIGRMYPDKKGRPMDRRTVKRIAQEYGFLDEAGHLTINED